MSRKASLGKINRNVSSIGLVPIVRLLLPLGWVLTVIGYTGPWIAHRTTALALAGVDMGEFVKFLPQVLDGSLSLTRQVFYLPPFAVAVSIAWLVGARRLGYPWPVRLVAVVLAIQASLQLLPPAWSPTSLLAAEFRLQTAGLVICWLLLAGCWLWGRLPLRLAASLAAVSALAAGSMSAWEFWRARPAMDHVYRSVPPVGWGFFLCLAGLVIVAGASLAGATPRSSRNRVLWPTE